MNEPPDGAPSVQPPELPPAGSSSAVAATGVRIAAWRWWIHLVVLASYVLGIGLVGALSEQPAPPVAPGAAETEAGSPVEPESSSRPALSSNPVELIATVAIQMGAFGVFFAVAWLASRAGREDLLLRWNRRRWLPWVAGFGYSLGMRVVIGVVVTVVLGIAAVSIMVSQGIAFDQAGFDSVIEKLGKRFQPNVNHLIDKQAMIESPLYVFLNMTLVSFGLAGVTEELWRAGMLAGCRALFPGLWDRRGGRFLFVVAIAVVFGLGHAPQGWGGVILTTLLGLMLGGMMVFHRSIWEAVLAHGFFNATSFIGMHLLFKYPDGLERLLRQLSEQLAS